MRFGVGDMGARYIALFVGTIFAFLSSMIVKNVWGNVDNQWASSLFVNVSFLIGMLLIYVASMFLAIGLYKERDL
ncbi:ABC transporter permease [Bacillus pseudomycoides]|uniref:ABC transporter permease n=2 Tax=Bacillus pseudomycoides TaxID=64104 RepID=A0AAJ1Z196_9BACI|nr:ABC transporter, permease component [Bacillus pseudomycoides]EEM09593.1 ABC transporter, permease component [Bacillus pseudomycoides]MDR4186894.1 ABC transporter permease [Bacillus pseudomycoides]MDR4326508.1 ABC transporter permease [Bacillus pseudomycoides]PDZ09235.1 ABC transporter permease [Bacillus pseudomycoides]